MLLIHCPYCEQERPESEFSHAGEAHISRPANPDAVSDVEWEAFLYLRANSKGDLAERWRHTYGCGQYFNAIRNTVTDRFSATYKAGQPRPTRSGGLP